MQGPVLPVCLSGRVGDFNNSSLIVQLEQNRNHSKQAHIWKTHLYAVTPWVDILSTPTPWPRSPCGNPWAMEEHEFTQQKGLCKCASGKGSWDAKISLDYSGEPNLATWVLRSETGWQKSGLKRCNNKRDTGDGSIKGTQPTIAGFEDGRREPQAKESRWPPEAENGS